MRILTIGDIVGRPGREVVSDYLPTIKKEYSVDFVVANAENLAHGRGATESTIEEMQSAGVDFFTGGDHLLWRDELGGVIYELPIIRPANYPKETPGLGHSIIKHKKGKLLLINLLGRTHLNDRVASPFEVADVILEDTKDEKPEFIVIDFHAEATSEKGALAHYLDGRVTAVVGTHTHVPTCDNMVLLGGTMFVTDVGMSGNVDSVLGVRKEIIIRSYLSAMNQRFDWENVGRRAFRSVLLDTGTKTIVRVDKLFD